MHGQVPGGAKMLLRSTDPDWLSVVAAWWAHLLPALAPYMVTQGGPVLMVQVRRLSRLLLADDATQTA